MEKLAGNVVYIITAFAQRRQFDYDHREPEIQVLAEFANRDRLLQVSVGRGNDTDIGVQCLASANSLKRLLLEKSQ